MSLIMTIMNSFNMKTFGLFTFLLFHFIIFNSFSQTLDQDFQLPIPVKAAEISAMKVQEDGKILVGGNINFFGNQRVNNLIRLNQDGTLDENFSFTSEAQVYIKAIDILSNGEVIIAGSSLMKLSSSGQILNEIDTIDVKTINIQDDDKIIVLALRSGFTSSMYRFDQDIHLDSTFNQTNIFNGWVEDAALQGDKIIVAGSFSEVNKTIQNGLTRFSSDGSLDHNFDIGSGTPDIIKKITVQQDGKILLGKACINSFNGNAYTSSKGILRLNANGSVDTNFNTSNQINCSVSKPILQGTDIFVIGYLSLDSLVQAIYLYKLKSNGDLDASFIPVKLANETPPITTIPPDFIIVSDISGEIIINNTHFYANEYGLSKFDKKGQIDQYFNPEVGTYGEINTGDYLNGHMIVGGDFIRIGETHTRNLARLNADGTVDENFIIDISLTINAPTNRQPSQITIVDDDTIFVALGNELLRLNSKGEVDNQFTSHGVTNPSVFAERFRILENRNIVTASSDGIFMLNDNGSEDLSFADAKEIIGGGPYYLDLQPTGIVYTTISPQGREIHANIRRLHFDGSNDLAFDTGIENGSGANYFFQEISVLKDDGILITGYFDQFNGVTTKGLVKLLKNGQVDDSFIDHYNTTIPEGFSRIENNTAFRKGSIISGYNTKKWNYSLGFLNADGTYNADYSLPDEIIDVDKEIVPIVVNADSLILLSRFQISGQPDPSFVLRLIFDDRPKITGTTDELSTLENTPLKLTMNDLLITNADNSFPEDFALIIHEGDHYSVDGSQIIPDANFVGELTILVVVSDGTNESDIFNLSVEVTPLAKSVSVEISRDSANTQDQLIMITFSEKVDDFQLSDIQVINGTISDLVTEDSITFTAVVTPGADGKMTIAISSGAVYHQDRSYQSTQ